MGCGCSVSSYGTRAARGFLTTEEKIALLKEYQHEIEKESPGVSERIKELEK
jgi:hypothetical protein